MMMQELSYKLISGIIENFHTPNMHVNYLTNTASFKKMSDLNAVAQATPLYTILGVGPVS